MKEIKNEKYLTDLINDRICKNENQIELKNLIFEFEDFFVLDVDQEISLSFKNCILKGKRADITLKKCISLSFIDTWIYNNTFIKNSEIEYLTIENCIVEAADFTITTNKIKRASIFGSFERKNKFHVFQYNYNETDYFDCRLNIFINQNNFYRNTFNQIFTFNGNISDRFFMESCVFKSDFHFWKNTLGQINKIEKSTFEKVFSSLTNYGINTEFENNLFNDICDFTKMKSNNCTLVFKNNTFHNTLQFDFSQFKNLEFISVIFKDITSFSNIRFGNKLKFSSSHFEKVAFFDNIQNKENSLNLLDLNTIRVIKNQLSKSENKIDYKKFYAYEQRKYLQLLSWKDSDYYILNLNKFSNDYGRNWTCGILFTFCSSLFFFLILILINTLTNGGYKLVFNLDFEFEKVNIILLEYLKFTFSLTFNSVDFQQNGWIYSVFILGKIFVGIGIYQTITAFRKFA